MSDVAQCPCQGEPGVECAGLLPRRRAVNERHLVSSVRILEDAENAQQRAAELEAVLAAVADGLVIYSPTGEIVRTNPAAEKILAYSAKERARPLAERLNLLQMETVDSQPPPPEKAPVRRALRGEVVQDVRMVAHLRDRTIWMSVSAAPICSPDGHLLGAVATFTDITARRETERSLSQLAAIVESSADAIIGKTLDGIITSWNPAAERLYGYAAAEVIGKPISIIIPPDHPVEVQDILARIKRGERVEQFETTGVTKDGRQIDVSVTVSPVKNAIGRLIGASTIAQDISERKRAEEGLRQSEERFRKIFEEGPLGMAIVARDGRFVKVNATLGRMLGYSEEEVTALRSPDITFPEDREPDLKLARQLFQGEIPYYQIDKRYIRKDGEILWVRLTASVIRDEQGKPLYGLRMVEDITDRKRLEQERARAEKLQREFLFLVSHEFRTPLTVAVGNLQVVRQRLAALPDRVARDLADRVEAAWSAAWRLSAMVEGLLDVTAIGIGKLKLLSEPLSLPQLIREELKRLRPMTTAHRVSVEVPEEFPTVTADRRRVAEVLANLITNAVKYTPPGTKITLRLEQRGKEAMVSVSDNGPGIPPEEVPRLFDRFYRARAPDLGLREGLGLGLYVNKAVVEAHGGRMWVESMPGRDSTFYFTLPVAGSI